MDALYKSLKESAESKDRRIEALREDGERMREELKMKSDRVNELQVELNNAPTEELGGGMARAGGVIRLSRSVQKTMLATKN